MSMFIYLNMHFTKAKTESLCYMLKWQKRGSNILPVSWMLTLIFLVSNTCPVVKLYTSPIKRERKII
jgi:hypothetical protein